MAKTFDLYASSWVFFDDETNDLRELPVGPSRPDSAGGAHFLVREPSHPDTVKLRRLARRAADLESDKQAPAEDIERAWDALLIANRDAFRAVFVDWVGVTQRGEPVEYRPELVDDLPVSLKLRVVNHLLSRLDPRGNGASGSSRDVPSYSGRGTADPGIADNATIT